MPLLYPVHNALLSSRTYRFFKSDIQSLSIFLTLILNATQPQPVYGRYIGKFLIDKLVAEPITLFSSKAPFPCGAFF